MDKLLFGTAGIPHAARGEDTAQALKTVSSLGLDAMELEFVHSVNISKDKAPLVAKAALDSGITLTCHAPYYINLNAKEPEKIQASIARIIHSAEITNLCNGYSVTFHAGFYLKEDEKKVYSVILENIKKITSTLKDRGIGIWIRPETTGKQTQFGSIQELIKLSSECEQVLPCIDFSHLHARSGGQINSYDEFSEVLGSVEKNLGRPALKDMHMHVSGIAYSQKGEQHHLNLEESDLKYKELLRAIKDFKCRGVLVCESPNIEEDALLMKNYYSSLK